MAAIRTYKPTTPGRRGMTSQNFEAITTDRPLKKLLTDKKGSVGRNNKGRITTRHRSGGAKKRLRMVSFKLPQGTSAVVEHIEYDPGRSAHIARIKDQNDNFHYVLAAKGMKPGTKVIAADETPLRRGNRMPLKNIPLGSQIHAVELQPGRGAQLVRSAGAGAQLVAKEGAKAQVRLPSGEIRVVDINCTASIGSVGNEQHQNVTLGKAGRKRHMGIRPTVRGKATNPADHPMGGGEGVSSPGRIPRSPWGQIAVGLKTRSRRKSSKAIIRSRHQAKRR